MVWSQVFGACEDNRLGMQRERSLASAVISVKKMETISSDKFKNGDLDIFNAPYPLDI